MKPEHIEGNEGNQTKEFGEEQEQNDFVRKRLSLLDRRLEAFLEQLLANTKEGRGAGHRPNENHAEKHPRTPPIQRPCWHEKKDAENGHVDENAEGEFEHGRGVFLASWLPDSLFLATASAYARRRIHESHSF